MLQFAPAPGGMLASYSVLQTVIHHLNQGGRRELSDANTAVFGALGQERTTSLGQSHPGCVLQPSSGVTCFAVKKKSHSGQGTRGANEHKGKGNGLVLEASSAGLVFIHRSLYTMASSF